MTPSVHRAKRVTAAVRAVEAAWPLPSCCVSAPPSFLCVFALYLPLPYLYIPETRRRYGSHVLDRARRRRFAVWSKPSPRGARGSLDLSSGLPGFLPLADDALSETQSSRREERLVVRSSLISGKNKRALLRIYKFSIQKMHIIYLFYCSNFSKNLYFFIII